MDYQGPDYYIKTIDGETVHHIANIGHLLCSEDCRNTKVRTINPSNEQVLEFIKNHPKCFYLNIKLIQSLPDILLIEYFMRFESELLLIEDFKMLPNPSATLITAILQKFPNAIKFTSLVNPSLDIVSAFTIYQNYECVKNYIHLYNDIRLFELLFKQPRVSRYLKDLSMRERRYVCSKNGNCIKYIKQTLELCKIAITCFYKNKDIIPDKHILKSFKYFDDDIINMIIKMPKFINELNLVPREYITDDVLDKIDEIYINAINYDPNIILQFDSNIVSEHAYDLAFDIAIKLNDYNLLSLMPLTNKMINTLLLFAPIKPNNLKAIPPPYHTKELCQYIISNYSFSYLEYCRYIDNDILDIIRNNDFRFINLFEEESIIRIIKIRPSLLSVIRKQTDNIINAALTANGLALEHVLNNKMKHLLMAVQNIKSIKYIMPLYKKIICTDINFDSTIKKTLFKKVSKKGFALYFINKILVTDIGYEVKQFYYKIMLENIKHECGKSFIDKLKLDNFT